MLGIFHRPELAQRLANQILAEPRASASSSGVFLAAPRRTGKSTFVREDLMPALSEAGALSIYVDLWANRLADPANVVLGAIRVELAKHAGVVARIARRLGLEKIQVGGLSASMDRVGLGKDVSLADALSELSDEIKKVTVLIIDEAQHSITTKAGFEMLFALKAARDELNSSRHSGLRVVATGSNRDKLAMLRNSKDQAFFGAPLVNFPVLDRTFVEWFCVEAGLEAPLNVERTWELFVRTGHRPEVLGAAVDKLRFDLTADAKSLDDRFADVVAGELADAENVTLQVIHGLTPLQSAVLRVLAAAGDAYAPFEAATMTRYRAVLKVDGVHEDVKVDTSNVQAALAALQEKTLVWRAERGIYALEESSLADLLRRHGLLARQKATKRRN